MCFVHQNGVDTTCRNSADGSMTLVSYPTGNPKLTVYSGNTLPYTYGRLAGLAGSVDGYIASGYSAGSSLVPMAPDSLAYRFGRQRANCPGNGQMIDNSDTTWSGVWHGWCDGMSFRPWQATDNELASGTFPSAYPEQPNPSEDTYGFRLYVGP
jgi:hypothetical protein